MGVGAAQEIAKIALLGELKPEIMKAFAAFDKAALADGALPKKSRTPLRSPSR
jgi:hypothetical protein